MFSITLVQYIAKDLFPKTESVIISYSIMCLTTTVLFRDQGILKQFYGNKVT